MTCHTHLTNCRLAGKRNFRGADASFGADQKRQLRFVFGDIFKRRNEVLVRVERAGFQGGWLDTRG